MKAVSTAVTAENSPATCHITRSMESALHTFHGWLKPWCEKARRNGRGYSVKERVGTLSKSTTPIMLASDQTITHTTTVGCVPKEDNMSCEVPGDCRSHVCARGRGVEIRMSGPK
jgi:hypothetical protein